MIYGQGKNTRYFSGEMNRRYNREYIYEVIIMEVIHGRGYVYSIQYHIVWCVKYRHKILVPTIEKRLLEILNIVAECEDFQILEANTDKDHIHLLINCSPHHYIPNIVQKLKGVSSRIRNRNR